MRLTIWRCPLPCPISFSFFFTDTATPEIYTLSLHDALPISSNLAVCWRIDWGTTALRNGSLKPNPSGRSEEHTSELQSRVDLVCRLLLEKKKMTTDLTS